MYRHCLSCSAPLGANAVLDGLPLGKRLAFDPRLGRLWVVCGGCRRWNLVGMEERWEVLERCEAMFRGTRLRASTAQIGLSRPTRGLELIRIGDPLPHEFAIWRYGSVLARRRLGYGARAVLSTVGIGALGALSLAVIGLTGGGEGVAGAFPDTFRRMLHGNPRQVVAMLPRGSGSRLRVTREQVGRAALWGGPGDRWRIRVVGVRGEVEAEGDAALKASRRVLPFLNRSGASAAQLREATDLIERSDGPMALFSSAARLASTRGFVLLERLPAPMRIALEMAAYEEMERRALAGELEQLRQEWKEAEEIASIADRLGEGPEITATLERYRLTEG